MLKGYAGEKIKKKLTITSLEGQSLKITDITCNIEDKIKYKLKTKEKGKEYTLEIKNRSKQAGSFRGKIELKTNSEKKPLVTLSINGNLRNKVMVRPRPLSFGTIDTTKEYFKDVSLRKTIMLKDIRGEGLTIKKIKPSRNWIMAEAETRKEGKQHTIVITLDKDKLPKGHFEEIIKIRTNYKRKFLVVNVKGDVI
jgi:hypothetical protein